VPLSRRHGARSEGNKEDTPGGSDHVHDREARGKTGTPAIIRIAWEEHKHPTPLYRQIIPSNAARI
jgi:hypothetical protein